MKTKYERASSKTISKRNSTDVIIASKSARNVGVWFDNLVSMDKQIVVLIWLTALGVY